MKESEPFVKLMRSSQSRNIRWRDNFFWIAGRLTDFADLTKRVGLVSEEVT